MAIKRALNNVLSNAFFYAKNENFGYYCKKSQNKGTLIIFEDDGPGVPKIKEMML